MRQSDTTLSRRGALIAGGTALGGAMLGRFMAMPAYAADEPPIGTWPEGASASSVFIGITVPRTGTYAVQGEDELKGYELAIEHINAGDPLIKKISPKTTKGVLGKELKYGVADSAAKEDVLSSALTKLFALVENYPQLKSNENVKQLQEELTSTENKISFARQFYNDIATRFNTAQQVFPANLIASMFNFKPSELFEIQVAAERDVPNVDLSLKK